jgi:hypothetical protein
VKPAAGYRPLAYSSPEAVQTTGTVANHRFLSYSRGAVKYQRRSVRLIEAAWRAAPRSGERADRRLSAKRRHALPRSSICADVSCEPSGGERPLRSAISPKKSPAVDRREEIAGLAPADRPVDQEAELRTLRLEPR